jgi:flagellar motor protein MotB
MIATENEQSARHAEEDENYFVSMTDMMVGILFIFIIMLMVFALNFQKQTDQTETLSQDRIDQLQRANQLAEQIAELRVKIESEITELNKADQARAEMLKTIKDRLDKVGLKVTIDADTGVLRLTEDAVRFASNSADLDVTAARNVEKVAEVLTDVLPAYSACAIGATCEHSTGYVLETVFIEGHTDSQGSDDTNWRLSTERAVNTYRHIVDNYPGLRRLRNSSGSEVLSVSGYAYTRPVVEGVDDRTRQMNRRIDLRFVMEADRRQRLNEVLKLLDQMEDKVNDLQTPTRSAVGSEIAP